VHSHAHAHGGHVHSHEHAHGGHVHSHEHAHAGHDARIGRAFLVGIALNAGFVALEAVFGVIADSTALLADAAHNLGDVLGLVMAWGAASLARRPPSKVRTYGLRRSTVLAALANAVLLLVAVGMVAWEAVGRLREPVAPHGVTMMAVAGAGVAVNGLSALLFHKGSKSDLNVRGAFLHLVADAAVSAGVVVAGAIVWASGWSWVDPATSILVSLVVLYGTWGLLRDSLHLSMDGVPKGIELEQVRTYLAALPEVEGVHDLHVWAMSTTEFALTAHLVIPWRDCPPPFLADLEHQLAQRFGIAHVTVQLEPAAGPPCGRSTPDVV
jgi:cobalt-zinc-cadmium efflux system protein